MQQIVKFELNKFKQNEDHHTAHVHLCLNKHEIIKLM